MGEIRRNEGADRGWARRRALARIRASLERLRDALLDLSVRIERPILEVGSFLESMQDLEPARAESECGSRLVVALQSYDMFHQEIRLAEQSIGLLTMAMREEGEAGEPALLANAESVCFHLETARSLIQSAAAEIPPAVSQVLRVAGATPRNFQNCGIHRSLDEIGVLTGELGETTGKVESLREDLAKALGKDPGERHFAAPRGEVEGSSVTLF